MKPYREEFMPTITVSKEMHNRLVEFKQVVEAVLEEKISIEDCTALILGQGIDSMLGDIVGFADATTLLASFQQLGSQAPAEVYRYVAETLRRGAAIQQRERMRQKLGFSRQMDS